MSRARREVRGSLTVDEFNVGQEFWLEYGNGFEELVRITGVDKPNSSVNVFRTGVIRNRLTDITPPE